jgi:LysM repeat protein
MKYTIIRGDTLGTIAAKFLGDKSRYKEILNINPQITDPNKIFPGQIINIPNSSSSTLLTSSNNVQPSTQQISQSLGFADRLKAILGQNKVVFSLLALGLTIFLVNKKKK